MPRRPRITEPPPAAPIVIHGGPPAVLETVAATSDGVVTPIPSEAIAYSLHRAPTLAARLGLLATISDEDALVAAALLLIRDERRDLAEEVQTRITELRRARADAAEVVEPEPRHVLFLTTEPLLTPLEPEELDGVRRQAITAHQAADDARREERRRAAEAKAAISDLESAAAALQRMAHTGQDYRPQQVEVAVVGREVITCRLDTGEEVSPRRDATEAEMTRAAQVPMWGGR